MQIVCSTLFDITQTDISSRRNLLGPSNDNPRRQQQRNFETIIQLISLRSQPEDISSPTKSYIALTAAPSDFWGTAYKFTKKIPVWSFNFNISHASIFRNEDSELGLLLADCDNVPMIVGLEEWDGLTQQLSNTKEFKNIQFKVISNA